MVLSYFFLTRTKFLKTVLKKKGKKEETHRVLSPYMLVVPRPGKIKKKNNHPARPKKKPKMIYLGGTSHKPLRVTRTGLMNKVTPSQPERDPIGQTPKEKGSMQHGERKKVAYRAPAAQDCKPPMT